MTTRRIVRGSGTAGGRAGGSLVDEVDDGGQHAGVGLGKDTVAEVEDVAPQLPSFLEDLDGSQFDHRERREADGRIEVSLQSDVRADSFRRHRKRHAPVHPDDLRAGSGHEAEQLAGPDAEMDPGNPKVAQAVEDSL
jgi:hypothetical protein